MDKRLGFIANFARNASPDQLCSSANEQNCGCGVDFVEQAFCSQLDCTNRTANAKFQEFFGRGFWSATKCTRKVSVWSSLATGVYQ
ncbi:hypothetical protein L596_001947 [Steinernema carpocapsae]|uniref:Uncharacterized protein n=1 Tax=Steinernema carpocapsae TaxID=34508 RepID=A0A4V6I790_STECR|nr:hypothetical protein L596_001947 [Steinernema carpocapsae]